MTRRAAAFQPRIIAGMNVVPDPSPLGCLAMGVRAWYSAPSIKTIRRSRSRSDSECRIADIWGEGVVEATPRAPTGSQAVLEGFLIETLRVSTGKCRLFSTLKSTGNLPPTAVQDSPR